MGCRRMHPFSGPVDMPFPAGSVPDVDVRASRSRSKATTATDTFSLTDVNNASCGCTLIASARVYLPKPAGISRGRR